MGIFDWLFDDMFGDDTTGTSSNAISDSIASSPLPELETTYINPASGLPMIGGIGGIDVAGNVWGTDHSHDCSFTSSSLFDHGFCDDSWSSLSCSSSFDDWSSGSSSCGISSWEH